MATIIEQASDARQDWGVELLRYTCFTTDKAKPVGLAGWWQKITGGVPIVSNRDPNSFLESGPVGGRRLTLQWQPGRLDWLVNAVAEPTPDIPGPLSIGALGQVAGDLKAYLDKWFVLDDCPPSKRNAYGAVLFAEVGSREEGYRFLQTMLPNIRLADARDFIFRINRQRPSKVAPGVMINRVCNWSVVTLESMMVEVRMGAVPMVRRTTRGQPKIAARLELDFNTAPEGETSFDAKVQSACLGEFVSMAQESALKGDVP